MPRPGALDWPGFHRALVQAQKAFRRQAENGAVVAQAQIAGKGRRAGGAQGAVGRPGFALARRAKALGKVHLVAVAGEDIGLDCGDRLLVAVLWGVGAKAGTQAERLRGCWSRLLQQGQHAFTFVCRQLWVTHQLAGAALMVTDQGPGIQAETRVGQAQVIGGLVRHGFQASAKVVRQVTQQPTDKRQLVFSGKVAGPRLCRLWRRRARKSLADSSVPGASSANGQALRMS